MIQKKNTLIHGKDNAYKVERKTYYNLMLKTYWDNFELKELKVYEKYSLQLDNMFESNWGYGAMHPGIFLADWVKPSGTEEMDMVRLFQ